MNIKLFAKVGELKNKISEAWEEQVNVTCPECERKLDAIQRCRYCDIDDADFYIPDIY
jgi:hypothetical protein